MKKYEIMVSLVGLKDWHSLEPKLEFDTLAEAAEWVNTTNPMPEPGVFEFSIHPRIYGVDYVEI